MASPTKSSRPLAPAAAGIRLGSSTLSLAVNRLNDGFDGKPAVVASETGERTTPTVVAWANGEWIIGEAAKQQAAKNPKNTFMNLLNLLGAKADDAEALKSCKGITTKAGEDNLLLLQPIDTSTQEADGEAQDPVALLAMLLRKLKELAEENAGHGGKVGPVIFTVPCGTSQAQCEGASKAGSLAGFDVLQVVQEPVAICLAYKLDASSNMLSKKDQLTNALKNCAIGGAGAAAAADTTGIASSQTPSYIMIVDIGGSDTSATILTCDNGMMNIVATESSPLLSGKLMVEEVVKFAAMFFKRKNSGCDPMESKKSATRLRQVCEGTLRFLSNAAQADIEVESLHEGMDLRARLSRARFEDMCDFGVLDKTIDAVLAKANLTKEQMDRVMLAGGAARVPRVISKISNMFPPAAVKFIMKEQPDEAGALGAALQASRLVCDMSKSAGNKEFMRDYKKSEHKLHKEVPVKLSIATVSESLGLISANTYLQIVSPSSALPIQNQCSLFLSAVHDSEKKDVLKSDANGQVVVDLVEGNNRDKVASFTFESLPANTNHDLVCFLNIDVEGNVGGVIRVMSSGNSEEVLVKYAEESKEGSEVNFNIPAATA